MYFPGFPAGKTHLTPLPEAFFTDLLPRITSLSELKVILHAFYLAGRREGNYRYLEERDFSADANFLSGLDADPARAALTLAEALRECVRHGVLLDVILQEEGAMRTLYFLNTARGRSAAEAARSGKWTPPAQPDSAPPPVDRRNIFRLYEENIGPLTPMLADILRDAEKTYPPDWIEHAFQIAVARNARSWRYVEAILRGWQERGHDEAQPHGNAETDGRKYVEGKYAEYIRH